jgi:hypothetical protein
MTTQPDERSMNPYLAGFLLGLVLLAAFLVVGRGLTAIGGLVTATATTVDAVRHARGFGGYHGPANPLHDWVFLEVVGIAMGALLVRWWAGQPAVWQVERGPQMGARGRLIAAFAGGVLMAVGARIGGGCTSGQALTGGALLNAGSWLFMGAVFAGAYLLAWPLRRLWV